MSSRQQVDVEDAEKSARDDSSTRLGLNRIAHSVHRVGDGACREASLDFCCINFSNHNTTVVDILQKVALNRVGRFGRAKNLETTVIEVRAQRSALGTMVLGCIGIRVAADGNRSSCAVPH